jgi:glycosyltransferase involved in cell wall biosynthesis
LRDRWSVVAPFFSDGGRNRWIDDFVTNRRWRFEKVPITGRDDWHTRSKRTTGLSKWRQYWEQSKRAFPSAGIVTVFPQPALAVALRKYLRRTNVPLIAWCFNLGDYPTGIKQVMARAAFKNVDRFVVHSTAEIRRVAEFLDVSDDRVEFVPLQRAPIPIVAREDDGDPFIVSMGSANRDFGTFLQAARISRLPCKVVASPRALEGLDVPDNVSVMHGLTPVECHTLVQRSRFSVVPLADVRVASGQVTVIESMRMDRAVVATKSIGTTDYIDDARTGLLVPPHDPAALAAVMTQLWEDRATRESLAQNAARFAKESLSDEAAAKALIRIIGDVELSR